jgi:hypothetical protein
MSVGERIPIPGQDAPVARTGTLLPYTTRNALSGYETEAPMAATTTYLSLGAFYAANKRRDISREHDLGLWWLGDDWHAPRFRAAWVAQTGELYLMQHEGTTGGGRVDVVATASSLEEMERRLDGWRDVVGEWGSVHWLRDRLGLSSPAEAPRFAPAATAEVA